MSKYTPGPWIVVSPNPEKCLSDQINDRLIVGPQGEHIAETFQVMTPAGTLPCPPENQSVINANLMAAAPEMYEALEWLVNLEQGVNKAGDGYPGYGEHTAAMVAAGKVLAKARGGE